MKKIRKIALLSPVILFLAFFFCHEKNRESLDFEKVLTFFQEELLPALCDNIPLDLEDSKDIDLEEVILNVDETNLNIEDSTELVFAKSQYSQNHFILLDKKYKIYSPPPEA